MQKLLLVLLLLISSNIYSQAKSNIEFDLKSTDWFKDDFKRSFLAFTLSVEKGGLISGRNYRKGCMIEKFDQEMNLKEKLNIDFDGKERMILNGYLNQNYLFLIEYFENEKEDRSEYSVLKISADLKILERLPLFSIPKEELHFAYYSTGLINDIDNNETGYLTLSDKHFAISFNTSTKGKERHRIKLFDKETLNEKFEHVLDLDFENSKTNFENLVIDDENEQLFAAFSYFPDDKKIDFGIINIRAGETHIFKFNKELQNSHKINSKYLLASPRLKLVENKVFLFNFFANEDVREEGYKGLSYHKFDKNNLTLEKETYNEFTKDFIFQKYGKDKKRPMIKAVLTSIYVSENGFVMDAEYNNLSISGQKVGNDYTFGDLIITSLNKEGELNWFKSINKMQSSGYKSEFRYFGYKSHFKNNKLFIVFNADEDVKEYKDERRIEFENGNVKKMKPYLIKINKDGAWTYKLIDTLDLDKSPLLIRNGQSFDNNFLFINYEDKEKKIVKLIL